MDALNFGTKCDLKRDLNKSINHIVAMKEIHFTLMCKGPFTQDEISQLLLSLGVNRS